jgi:hypothetical protein
MSNGFATIDKIIEFAIQYKKVIDHSNFLEESYMNRKNIFPCAFFVGLLVFVSTLSAQISSRQDDLAVYEQYGLTFNHTKSLYCYNDKIVGILVDPQGRNISLSNTEGEINIKVIRDNDGRINGFEVLTVAEYNAIIAVLEARTMALGAREAELEKRMEDLRERMGNMKSPIPYRNRQNRR